MPFRLYELWQKRNEADVLLTMNFILFTNQGYPLQSSFLGQLHTDGGVVSIVRQLVGYVLLDIIQSTENGAFSSGL